MATAATLTPMDPENRHYPLVYPPTPPPAPKRPKPWKPKGPFPFARLPSELRTLVLEHALILPRSQHRTIDLDPQNRHDILPRLNLLLVSKQLHADASRIFYSTHTFRILPTHGRFFHTQPRHTLLSRLPRRHLAHIRSVELRVGPGWSSPPKSWRIADAHKLEHCVGLRELRVFAECDPSHDAFSGFRGGKEKGFYAEFVGGLVSGVLERTGGAREGKGIERVVVERWPSVRMDGELVRKVVERAQEFGKSVLFVGPEDAALEDEEQAKLGID
ncbi:MAG: hypothetical protein M1828_000701 [Chrysothrix sp. TS-e1954]|nr:MAG: hypothetical protein M1828_000701 [Chrysothrix sp. TS-e1954]